MFEKNERKNFWRIKRLIKKQPRLRTIFIGLRSSGKNYTETLNYIKATIFVEKSFKKNPELSENISQDHDQLVLKEIIQKALRLKRQFSRENNASQTSSKKTRPCHNQKKRDKFKTRSTTKYNPHPIPETSDVGIIDNLEEIGTGKNQKTFPVKMPAYNGYH